MQLALIEHQAAKRLHLRGEPTGLGRGRRFWSTILDHFAPVPRHPLRLNSLQCNRDAEVLQLSEVWSWLSPCRRLSVPVEDITALRLRVIGKTAESLLLRLSITLSTGEPPVKAEFCVDALDRDDEAIDLALRIARCSGLRGYRIRHRTPADVELARSPDMLATYRTAVIMMPVPTSDGPIDYEAHSAPSRAEPVPLSDVVEPSKKLGEDWQINDGWQIDQWKPGDQVQLSRPGLARLQAALLTALIRVPLTAISVVGGTAVLWGAAVLALLVFLSPFLFYAMLHGNDPPIAVAYIVGVFGALSGLFGVGWSVLAVTRLVEHGHRTSLARMVTLDWTSLELIEHWGGHETKRMPFDTIETAVTRLEESWISLVLLLPGDDQELFRVLNPTKEQVQTIDALTDELCGALKARSAS